MKRTHSLLEQTSRQFLGLSAFSGTGIGSLLRKAATVLLLTAAIAQDGFVSQTHADTAVNFLSYHFNRERQGWNANEKTLTPAIVATPSFGELWNSPRFASFGSNLPVLYAVPLYVDSVTLTGGSYSGNTLSVVYAGTTNGDLYAVCASGVPGIPAGTILWTVHLGDPGSSNDNSIPRGILGTPVIDLNHTPPTIYVASETVNIGWRAFALDITNGTILPGWPVSINDTTVAPVLQNGPATFGAPGAECQRGGLNLSADGTKLYVPFGDYSDNSNGYMMILDTVTPQVTSAFAGCPSTVGGVTPSKPYAGMWAAAGPSLDSNGRLYTTTGNCPVPSPASADQIPGFWGMSVLAFGGSAPLTLTGTYTPWNYPAMDVNDTDLCGSSPIVLPDMPGMVPHLLALGGKQGNSYLLDRDNLPGGLSQRPATNLTPSQDGSLLPPTPRSYYNNQVGPLNIFGPYSENSNQSNLAKSRATPAYFRAADGTSYLIHTGATKAGIGSQTPVPPCVIRVKINTSPTSPPYLSVDGTENTLAFFSPGSPVITSNGGTNPISWNLDANVYRGDNLKLSKPYLVGVDVMTMQTVFKSRVGTLHAGGKYNEPSAARGMVFVGTDRLQVFGVTTNAISVNAGGPAIGTFQADAFSSGGQTGSTQSTVDISAVTNPAPMAVYQTYRTGSAGVGFTYTFPGLAPSTAYSVRLHFSEPTFTAAGGRKFNVAINGTSVLTNYDIVATAGAGNKAVTEPFNAVADGTGNITVAFSAGTASDPIVSGIEVLQIPGGNPVLSAPASGSLNGTPLTVSYFLPGTAVSQSLLLNFDDGTTVRTLTLADAAGTAGNHTITFPPSNPTSSASVAAGGAIPDGTYTITLGFQDSNGGTPVTSAPVTNVALDSNPPTIAPPQGGFTPTVLLASGAGTAALPDYTGQAVVSDNNGSPTVTQSPAPGTLVPIGQATVTLTARDGVGNTASLNFPVSIVDSHVVITLPTAGSFNSTPISVKFSIPGTPAAGTLVLRFDDGTTQHDLTLNDNLGTPGVHTISFAPSSPPDSDVAAGSPIPDGVYSLTLFYTDSSSNNVQTSTAVNNVTIDTTPPTISAPVNGFTPTAVTAGPDGHALIPNFTSQPIVSDNIGVTSVTQSPLPNTSKTVGPVNVTLTAHDASGNTASIGFTFTIRSGSTTYAAVANTTDAVPGAGGAIVPDGALFSTFGTPAINDAGQVAVLATWKAGKVAGVGILSGNPMQPVVSLISPVPGVSGAAWKSFTDPIIDENGHVAFLAVIGGKGIPTSTVLASNFSGSLAIVAQSGTVAPETPDGAKYKKFNAYSLRAGRITFVAGLAAGSGSPKVAAADDTGVFQVTSAGVRSQLVREGQTAALNAGSTTLKTFRLFSAVVGSPGQGRIEDATASNVAYVGTFANKSIAVMRGSNPVIEKGTGTGLPAGQQWAGFGAYSLNSADSASALLASLVVGQGGVTKTTASRIYLDQNNTFSMVARTASPTDLSETPASDAPGMPFGAKFSLFKDPVLAADSTGLAFIATVKGGGTTGANGGGIWWKPAGSPLKLAARLGDQPPAAVKTKFSSFTSVALPGGGTGPIFTAKLSGASAASNFGIWAVDRNGLVRALIRQGDTVLNNPVRTITALGSVKSGPGISRNFNNSGGLVLHVTYTGGKQGVIVITVP